MPLWQFTLSATQANTEAIRLARAVTGREVIVLFEGHYHGHFEEGLVDLQDGRASATQRGLCALTDDLLTRLIRVWLGNRGIWEALPGAGPTVPVPATREDVARYLGAYGELLAELR